MIHIQLKKMLSEKRCFAMFVHVFVIFHAFFIRKYKTKITILTEQITINAKGKQVFTTLLNG